MSTGDGDEQGAGSAAATFDACSDSYRQAVEASISFLGTDLDYFTQAKADHLLDIVGRRLGDPSTLKVLDVGCGVGVTDRLLVDHVGELHGVDVAHAAVERAREEVPGVKSYGGYDGSTLPFADGALDVAFCINVMHHVPPEHWPSFVREMRRVVRDGGLVLVFEHNKLNPLTRRAVARCEFDDDAVLLGHRKLKTLFTDAGLRVAEAPYIIFFPFGGKAVKVIERGIRWLPLGAQYCMVGYR